MSHAEPQDRGCRVREERFLAPGRTPKAVVRSGWPGQPAGLSAPALVASFLLVSALAPLAPGKENPKAKSSRDDPWRTLAAGLQELRARQGCAIVLHESTSAPRPLIARRALEASEEARGRIRKGAPQGLRARLEDSRLKKTLRAFVRIRLRPEDLSQAYPLPGEAPPTKGPTVAEVFGLTPQRAAVLVLDLRERVVERYEARAASTGGAPAAASSPPPSEPSELLPRVGRLKRRWQHIARVNAFFAREARRVEPLLEKARQSVDDGEPRAAVLVVRELEGEEAQRRMDPVLKERVSELARALRAEAETLFQEAEALDHARKYVQAIEAFQKAAQQFPFKDFAKRTVIREGEILRKLTFGK